MWQRWRRESDQEPREDVHDDVRVLLREIRGLMLTCSITVV
jgi:hypothetical protein